MSVGVMLCLGYTSSAACVLTHVSRVVMSALDSRMSSGILTLYIPFFIHKAQTAVYESNV